MPHHRVKAHRNARGRQHRQSRRRDHRPREAPATTTTARDPMSHATPSTTSTVIAPARCTRNTSASPSDSHARVTQDSGIAARPPGRKPQQRRADARDKIEESEQEVEAQTALDAGQRPPAPRRTGRRHQPVDTQRHDADQQCRHRAERGRRAEQVHECDADEIEPNVGRRQQTDPDERRRMPEPRAVHQHVAREIVGRVVIREVVHRPRDRGRAGGRDDDEPGLEPPAAGAAPHLQARM